MLHNYQSAKMDKTQLCSLDGNQLKDSKSLYQHNKLHLKEEHVCSICQKVFSLKNYLQKHLKLVHSDASYCCQDCDETFQNSQNLKCHRQSIHQKIMYSCKVCGKQYPRTDKLKAHYLKCKKSNNKIASYACPAIPIFSHNPLLYTS